MVDKDRDRVSPFLHLPGLAWHDQIGEILGLAIGAFALDQDLFEILVEHVAHGAVNQAAFGIDQAGRHGRQRLVTDLVPQLDEIVIVALDLGLGALGAGRADNEAHAVGHLEFRDDGFQPLAVCAIGDLAGNAATARGVGHQHRIAPGERKIGGQRCALVATLFLGDLDQHHLAAADDFLDLVFLQIGIARRALLALGAAASGCGLRLGLGGAFRTVTIFGVGISLCAGLFAFVIFVGIIRRVGFRLVLILVILVGGLGAGFVFFVLVIVEVEIVILIGRSLFGGGFQQRFAVCLGQLIIVGMDFGKGEEAVAITAIFDKCGLERGLYARDLGQIDISSKLFSSFCLEIEIVNLLIRHDGDPGLFRMGRVDQHEFAHQTVPLCSAAGPN